MSEVRLDPWSGAETILAPGRLSIGAVKPSGLPTPSARCPFCPGHEADAEATIAQISAGVVRFADATQLCRPGEPGTPVEIGEPWRVRVVANRYPLVAPTMPLARGAHEVIVEAREHDVDLPDLDLDAMTCVVTMYRDRSRALASLEGARSIVLFRNRGRRAGSSQPHPHAQIAALSYVPPHTRVRDERARGDRDLLGRTLASERACGRVVYETGSFVTFCPFASSRAHEVRIAPTRPIERLADLDDAMVAALADQLSRALRALRTRMGLADYNLLVRDPALDTRGAFFSVEILPRTGGDAGFELHTGSSICLVAPEETAAALRAIEASA